VIFPGRVEDVEGRQILPAVDVDVEHTLERRIERRLCLVDAHDVVAVGNGDLVREVGRSEPLLLVESLDTGNARLAFPQRILGLNGAGRKEDHLTTSAREEGPIDGL
jgi:hypothetical protein